MVTLQVKRSVRLPLDKSLLVIAAETTLNLASHIRHADVGIVIGNDALLKKLNHRFRGVDATTDVLSFASSEIDPDTRDEYLGDVIISLARAEDQALTEGHPLADELQLLVVHGVLHLLGYDHQAPGDMESMQAAQDKILSALDVNIALNL